MAHRILMIVTSHAVLGHTGKPTGVWAEELAEPFYQLMDAGALVTLASPKGGVVPLDPGSLKPVGENPASVERLLADEALQRQLQHSPAAATFKASDFDAVFFPGGHGTMWDLPVDAGVTHIVEAAFAEKKFIASVCHGAAGLVSAKRPDGQSIVKGLRVNGFTNAEEEAVGLTEVVPFLLETRLQDLGARFDSGENWQPFAVQDGQLITGQNPQSSALVAKTLLGALQAAAAR